MAETAIAHAAVKAGITVLRPLGDVRYDLVFDLETHFVRVQCKSATRRGDVIIVRCRSCRRTSDGFIRRPYNEDEIDAFAAYCVELDRCFYLPLGLFRARTAIQLRLAASRNNQRLGVNWADDYDFERLNWSSRGAIAQLGERLSGTQKVAGSSPAGSTRESSSLPPGEETPTLGRHVATG
jgi:hypothetical protein